MNEPIEKHKGTVGFQLSGPDLIHFERSVEELGVDRSVLAREAYFFGLKQAEAKLKAEKAERLKRLNGQLKEMQQHADQKKKGSVVAWQNSPFGLEPVFG